MSLTEFLPPLPFSLDSLEPYISSKTVDVHYNKHHKGYAQKTVDLIKGTTLENGSLDEIIHKSFHDKNTVLFNNSAQVFNHSFYWEGLCAAQKSKSSMPSKDSFLLKMIERHFPSLEGFKENLQEKALGHFGSGWAWLVAWVSQGDGSEKTLDQLNIISTPNGEAPIFQGQVPIFVIDVWEHAYYLDYHNRRKDYVESLLNNLIHWEKLEERLKKALGMV